MVNYSERQKAVKYTVDGPVIDSNRLIDLKDTVNIAEKYRKNRLDFAFLFTVFLNSR